MILADDIRYEVRGPAQETSGTDIIGHSTGDALTAFIEAKNAAMTPLLDPQGMSALYSEEAVLLHPLDGLPHTRVEGRRALDAHFSRIGEVMLSLVLIEECRTVEGRRAVWEGSISGVQAGTKKQLRIPAVFSLEFDDHDLVSFQRSYYSIDEAMRQIPDLKLEP